jgi:hypothetical protein
VVQRGAENGRDDEHVGSTLGTRSHLRAKGRISTRLVRDEENPLTLRERLVNHHSSIPWEHTDDRTHRPRIHRPEH